MLFGRDAKAIAAKLASIDDRLSAGATVVVAEKSPLSASELVDQLYVRMKNRNLPNSTSRDEVRALVSELQDIKNGWSRPEQFAFIEQL